MEIRETRPWFWILVAALAIVAIGGLVLAIAASNEGVDQNAAVDDATEQIQGEVSGLNEAVEACAPAPTVPGSSNGSRGGGTPRSTSTGSSA